MKRTCQYCKTEFVTAHKEQRFCSRECQRMYKRRLLFERDEQLAARMGITLEELRRMRKSGAFSKNKQKDNPFAKWLKRPRTYAEIRAANRRRQIEAGWRGQVVMGGGGDGARHNDTRLSIHELPRMRDLTHVGRNIGRAAYGD